MSTCAPNVRSVGRGTPASNGRGLINLSASVADRAVPGHWEGDLIGGSKNSYIAMLNERHSRYVMPVKVANKDTESVV